MIVFAGCDGAASDGREREGGQVRFLEITKRLFVGGGDYRLRIAARVKALEAVQGLAIGEGAGWYEAL